MNLFRVIKAGPRTTIQDSGRRHYQRHGLAQGGAADRYAYLCVNKLLDNDLNAPCLELTMGGLELEALADVSIAITGADCVATLNGELIQPWQSLHLKQGDYLCFSTPDSGRFTYLGIPGGFDSPRLFASHSTVIREQIEDLCAIETNQVLEGAPSPGLPARTLPTGMQACYSKPLRLKVLPGYQHNAFTSTDRLRFTTTEYRISNQSDRMGYRVEGGDLTRPPAGIVSEGIALGSIQVPGDGCPIILLNDRQTIGGYPKLGTLSSVDCFRLAQCRPGQIVTFEWADLAEIQNERRLLELRFRALQWSGRDGSLAWR